MKVIKNFLTQDELVTLRALSKIVLYITGPSGVYTFSYEDNKVSDSIYQKFLTASGLTPPLNGRDIQQFISYKQDGYIEAHKDWVDCGHELYRVNVLVDAAIKGGELLVDGVEVPLDEGDALVLRAELEEHEVKKVLEGSRMIFTIGFHHKTQPQHAGKVG